MQRGSRATRKASPGGSGDPAAAAKLPGRVATKERVTVPVTAYFSCFLKAADFLFQNASQEKGLLILRCRQLCLQLHDSM